MFLVNGFKLLVGGFERFNNFRKKHRYVYNDCLSFGIFCYQLRKLLNWNIKNVQNSIYCLILEER